MKDADCVAFLQWALPRLYMRWPGFRRVRRQVCKRIDRRMSELACTDVAAYRRYLEAHSEEWSRLDSLCRITVTRFYRNRRVFEVLVGEVLPALADAARSRGAQTLRVWSAGCGSGEEPYTLAIAWQLELAARHPDLDLNILATDADAALLSRATTACYPWGAIRHLPEEWRERAFEEHGGRFCLAPAFTRPVTLRCHDIRTSLDADPFDLILCRNLAFTYFEPGLQRDVAGALHDRLVPKGVLVLGAHERLPDGTPGFEVVSEPLACYRKSARADAAPG